MAKYRVEFEYVDGKRTSSGQPAFWRVDRKGWFLFFPYWDTVGYVTSNLTPLEAAQYEDQLNRKPVRTGEHF